jgi:small subunit ribosomal protein S5
MTKPEEEHKEPEEKVEVTKEEIIDHEEARPEQLKQELKKNVFDKESWHPRTELGKKIKSGEIKDISFILDNGLKIMEAEVVDSLVPNLDTELLIVGQSKGKFGGGQGRVFRQTQKKTKEGNKPKFGTVAIVGNHDGLVGIGYGKSKETVPAREKSLRNAKLNVIKISRGCGSWECGCGKPHSIPFAVTGKSGSVRLMLMPAPKGTGLCVEKEIQKILALAGIKDVWSRTLGKTRMNLVYACRNALKSLTNVKLRESDIKSLGIIEGPLPTEEKITANE